MSTELVLVRHGAVARVLDAAERADPGLSELGRAQALRLAEVLSGEEIRAVHSSPQRRALQTAEAVAGAIGLTVHQHQGLAEFDHGCGDYLFFDDLRAAGDPRYFACMDGDLTAWGTDATTYRERVLAAVGRIAADHPGDRILVSTHGGALNALLGSILGVDRFWFFIPQHTGISRVAVDAHGRMRIVTVNEFGHLRNVGVVGV